MHVEHLSSGIDLKSALKAIGVDGGGVSILRDKGKIHLIKIFDLHVGAANILKQDALSIGADLAVPKGTIIAEQPRVNALLIATERQLQELVVKEKAQPFGLKLLAEELKPHTHVHRPNKIEVMGILNANEDSFYSESRFLGDSAIAKIETMIEEGADIIDIGGVSSRPGSVPVTQEEEFRRVQPIIDAVYEQQLYTRAKFSLDSYNPSVLSYALERGFVMVNDITGLIDDEIARLCGEYSATAVIMHMQGTPKTMQDNPRYDSLVHEIEQFFRDRMAKAATFGIKNVVLDCGIGFGKSLEDNLALITHQRHFTALGAPLLVGASRKSMIDRLSPSIASERLGGTIALHLKAIDEGASMIRVHDVKQHVQAIKLWQALRG